MNNNDIDEVLSRASAPDNGPNPDKIATITAAIQSSLRPVRPVLPGWSLIAAAFLVFAAVALAGAARAGFAGIERMDTLERLLIFPWMALLAWIASIQFVNAMLPGRRPVVSSSTLVTLSSAALFAIFAFLFRDYQTSHFFSGGIRCLLTGLLHAAPAALLSWFVLRRGFAINPVSAGLAAGTLAGLSGVVLLELHCPNFEASHILVWHVAVVPLSATICASIAAFLDRRRIQNAPNYRKPIEKI